MTGDPIPRAGSGLVAEAIRSARSQPVVSMVAVLMVVGLCVTVLQTTGRAVGAQQSILTTIDSAGTRSIVVQADPTAGLTSDLLTAMDTVTGVSWSAALGPVADASNAAIIGGARVPIRTIWSSDLSRVSGDRPPPYLGAWGTPEAMRALGLLDGAGEVVDSAGVSHAVVGAVAGYEPLDFLQPVLFEPDEPETPGDVTLIVVVASSPAAVAPVAEAVRSLLPVDDPTQVSITTSEDLAAVRGLVDGQLDEYGGGVVVASFLSISGLLAAVLYGTVLLRRKDFGRRRALGASQRFIVALLTLQTTLLGLLGSLIGCAVSLVSLTASQDPLPSPSFFVAVGVLATAVSTVSALAPAVAAARREPLHELRVP